MAERDPAILEQKGVQVAISVRLDMIGKEARKVARVMGEKMGEKAKDWAMWNNGKEITLLIPRISGCTYNTASQSASYD